MVATASTEHSAGACVCCVSACVSCGFRLRNACNASDCVWMETGLKSLTCTDEEHVVVEPISSVHSPVDGYLCQAVSTRSVQIASHVSDLFTALFVFTNIPFYFSHLPIFYTNLAAWLKTCKRFDYHCTWTSAVFVEDSNRSWWLRFLPSHSNTIRTTWCVNYSRKISLNFWRIIGQFVCYW